MAFKLNNQDVRDYTASLGITIADDSIVLVGFAGLNLYGEGQFQLNSDPQNKWCDLVGMIGSEFAFYPATVKPGLTYTENPTVSNGAAHLMTIENPKHRQPYVFVKGLHHGQYPCLVQGQNFLVWRDKAETGVFETGDPDDSGEFGIHIHHAAEYSDAAVVGPWSAGCQVIQDYGNWGKFWSAIEASGLSKWHYYLIDAHDFVAFLQKQGRI